MESQTMHKHNLSRDSLRVSLEGSPEEQDAQWEAILDAEAEQDAFRDYAEALSEEA